VYETSNNRSTLRIPLQSAPIDRTLSGSAAFRDAAGVEAAGWLDDIVGTVRHVGDVVGKIGGVAGPILGALGSFGI